MKQLSCTVFPSTEKTISVQEDVIYGGAHLYRLHLCNGFNNGKTEYVADSIEIPFVQKHDDGVIIPGLQSEQLVYVLLDRQQKLNARFPSLQSEKMIEGLQIFLDACKERVQDRMNRGVMGNLKK